jgi:hypothetical protein
LYYSIVFPEPKRVLPLQLRNHIQAMVIRGALGQQAGRTDIIFIAPTARSASYALSIVNDLKLAAQLVLKTDFDGVWKKDEWGREGPDTWWAYEMVRTLEKASLEREQSVIRFRSNYERVMVNALLKTMERLGRDLAAMQGTFDEKKDPREVDAAMKSRIWSHYWSQPHQWGPDWPIRPANVATGTLAETETALPPAAAPTVAQAPAL